VIRAAVHDADTGFLMVLVIAVSSAIPAALPIFCGGIRRALGKLAELAKRVSEHGAQDVHPH